MSKLQEKIKRAGTTSPAPIGFTAAAARQPDPTMLTAVRVRDAGGIGAAAEKGADVILIEKADPGKLKKEAEKAGEASIGVLLDSASREDVAALRDAGADFIVLDPESSRAEAALEEKIGLVVSVDPAAEDTDLRLIGDLSLDALLLPALESPLTLKRALGLRRLAGLARTSLLVPVDAGVDASTLQVLRESGTAGAVLGEPDAGKLDRLKETIRKLPPRGRKREEHSDATLPAGVAHGDDDDDWDD